MPEWMLQIPFVAQGGVVMVILYALSLVGLALVLERIYMLRRTRVLPVSWSQQVQDAVAQRGLVALGDESVWPGYEAADVLRQVVRTGALHGAVDPAMIDQAVLRKEEELSSGIMFIGLLAAVSPLLGLLGTVAGMIETFSMIADGGIGDPKALAGGIYQALYTTAGGLTIAIPLTVAYRMLKRRARLLADRIAAFIENLVWLDGHIAKGAKNQGSAPE